MKHQKIYTFARLNNRYKKLNQKLKNRKGNLPNLKKNLKADQINANFTDFKKKSHM